MHGLVTCGMPESCVNIILITILRLGYWANTIFAAQASESLVKVCQSETRWTNIHVLWRAQCSLKKGSANQQFNIV